MGREIEGDRQAGLAGRQILPVKGVGLLGCGEPCVLAHGPRPAGVHGRPRSADEGRQARQRIEMIEAIQVLCRVQGLDRDALRGIPGQFIEWAAFAFLLGKRSPIVG
jgi:hypothetical protein